MDTLGPRDGEALDEVGQYHPIEGEAANQVRFDEEKVRAWLDKGAQPTHTVRKLLNRNQFTVR
jgi:small subunit ribosomal protein S16